MDAEEYASRIRRARIASPRVDEWCLLEPWRYGQSFGVDSLVGFEEIYQLMLEEIRADLLDAGIQYADLDWNEYLLDGYRNLGAIELLEVMEPDRLHDILLNNPELTETVRVALQGGEESLQLVMQALGDRFGVKRFLDYSGIWTSDSRFVDYCTSLLERAEVMRTVIDTTNIQHVQEYVQYKTKHIERVWEAMHRLSNRTGWVNIPRVDNRMRQHDVDLLIPEELNLISLYHRIRKGQINVSTALKQEAVEHHEQHHYRSKHHIEYWTVSDEEMEPLDVMEIVADVYDAQPTYQDYYLELQKELAPYQNHPVVGSKLNQILEVGKLLDILWLPDGGAE